MLTDLMYKAPQKRWKRPKMGQKLTNGQQIGKWLKNWQIGCFINPLVAQFFCFQGNISSILKISIPAMVDFFSLGSSCWAKYDLLEPIHPVTTAVINWSSCLKRSSGVWQNVAQQPGTTPDHHTCLNLTLSNSKVAKTYIVLQQNCLTTIFWHSNLTPCPTKTSPANQTIRGDNKQYNCITSNN